MSIIIFDCNAIGYAAHYSAGYLSRSDGTPTGVVYGFFVQMGAIAARLECSNFVFCWDSKESKRKELFNGYKEKRKPPEEDDTIQDAFWQFDELRTNILARLGFKNIFVADGYEADDLIARVIQGMSEDDGMAYIVSNDKDMYQLLSERVSLYKPAKRTLYTMQSFRDEYGIEPEDWKLVRAIAGCTSDNVPGVKRVGVATAIKYLTTPKRHPRIDSPEGHGIISRNWKLTVLPFDGCPECPLQEDRLLYDEWTKFCKEFEFHSFLRNSRLWQSIFSGKTPHGDYDDILFQRKSTSRRRKT